MLYKVELFIVLRFAGARKKCRLIDSRVESVVSEVTIYALWPWTVNRGPGTTMHRHRSSVHAMHSQLDTQ